MNPPHPMKCFCCSTIFLINFEAIPPGWGQITAGEPSPVSLRTRMCCQTDVYRLRRLIGRRQGVVSGAMEGEYDVAALAGCQPAPHNRCFSQKAADFVAEESTLDDPLVGQVIGLPHVGQQLLLQRLRVLDLQPRHPGNRLPCNGFADHHSDVARFANGRQQRRILVGRVGESEASVRAAVMIMLSVTRRAFRDQDAQREAGKMYELLVCEMRTCFPPTSTGGKGLPVPTSARPSVHRSRSSGTASALRGGVGEREDDGAGRVLGHGAHDLFREDAGLTGDAYQHRDPGVRDHIEERDLSFIPTEGCPPLVFCPRA